MKTIIDYIIADIIETFAYIPSGIMLLLLFLLGIIMVFFRHKKGKHI